MKGKIEWFKGGKLNASYNSLDVHQSSKGDKIAFIWEGDELGDEKQITFNELLTLVSKVGNVLKGNTGKLPLVTG